MANRTMQQKSMKLRRQRRAWAKEYSRPSGITPNRGVLQEYKVRAAGLGVSEFEVDELIRKLYGHEPVTGVTPGRVEVQELMAKLKKRVPQLLFFVILDNCLQRTVCFFDSQKTVFVLAHTDKRAMITRTSIEYGSKDRALRVWNMDTVTWVHRERAQVSPT